MDTAVTESFPMRLKSWREKRSLSQSEAAKVIGCPVKTLQDWEQGRRSPRGLAVSTLEKILEKK